MKLKKRNGSGIRRKIRQEKLPKMELKNPKSLLLNFINKNKICNITLLLETQ
jgi:hypothetical protein